MNIISIKKIKPKTVYAIETSTWTFVADWLAHHNCAQCNWYKSWRLDVYAEHLLKDYWEEWFMKLVKDSWSHQGYSVEEMLSIEKELKNKLLWFQ